MTLCNRNPGNVFFIKRCVGGRICHECGDLALFHRKFLIDPTHPRLSDIDLLEDEIPISDFLDKFQSQIYKYIKHSQRSRWQALEFKHSREVFESGTILSVVYFAENYTFAP